MLLHVKVTPNAKSTEFIDKNANGLLRFKVHANPEKGRANEELIDYLSKALKLAKQDVQLIKGHAARFKTFELPDHTQLPW